MCLREGIETDCGVLGMANIAGVCVDGRSSVVEDKAWSFTVVRGFAHEFAHNLGCVHDGAAPFTRVPGHPGAKTCLWDDGFLMTHITAENQFQFSNCCAEQIRVTSQLEEKLCLFYNNSDSSDRVETDALPGNIALLDKYCEIRFPHWADFHIKFDSETGIKADCRVPCIGKKVNDEGKPLVIRKAAPQLDGSPCDPQDKQKLCIGGVCKRPEVCQGCTKRPSQPKMPTTTTTRRTRGTSRGVLYITYTGKLFPNGK
ncbi:A disintegrin and metalloproteinase with thrombospondin motifs like [Ornithodoros turicata]|uniref:A disintegrin and metalloproteinase with thrombospondin motifs like n=1 Tax=Ornithodoros turicata TaxID=34597 RepID=UPI003138ED71